jgi:hypothetical protein
MSNYSFNHISTSTDRHKIYTLLCNPSELKDKIELVKAQNIHVINLGKELAKYIDRLDDYSYLSIDVCDYCKKLLNDYKVKINGVGNDVVAIYNVGIILEPILELKPVTIFSDFSISTALLIIWENQYDIPDRLNWTTQKNNYALDFSDLPLKKLQDAI